MKFLDERHQGVSPTLEALRVYREGRAAKRRTLPDDTPLDFAPKALEPLIRQNGQVDRRRWESALFMVDEVLRETLGALTLTSVTDILALRLCG